MTTISRIGSVYSSAGYGGYSSGGFSYKRSTASSNIFSNNNFSLGLNYLQAGGIGFGGLKQIKDMLDYNNGFNLGYNNNINNQPIFGATQPMPPAAHNSSVARIRTISNGDSNNPFASTSISTNGYPGNLHYRHTSLKSGGFGALTTGNKLSSMNIHTPSVDYNSTTAKTPFGSLTKTNIAGDIDSYKRTSTRINTPNANLNRTREVIETPTETITRTRTKGVIYR